MHEAIRIVAAMGLIAAWCGTPAGAGTLRGMVVAADGSPAVGARVWAVDQLAHGLDRREAVADLDGRYAIEVGPGLWITQARLEDQGPADVPWVATVGAIDPSPATIRLQPQGRLRARLIQAETGRPLAGGRLFLDNGLDLTTDDQGRAEVGGMSRRGYHEAFAVAPGRERFRVLFEMAEGPTTDLEVAVPLGVKVVGRVLDRAGRPVARPFVSLSASAQLAAMGALWVRGDEQGGFEYDGFPADRATPFQAAAEGFEDARWEGLRAPVDGSPLGFEFRLAAAAPGPAAPAREVVGVVVDPEGRPAAARLRWGFDPLARSAEARTDAAGRFRLAPVPDAIGSIGVLPDRLDLAATTVSVGRADQEVRVALEPGHTATGVVRAAEGTPRPGVAVVPSILEAGRMPWSLLGRRTLTDDRGRFLLAGLPGTDVRATFLGEGIKPIVPRPLDLNRENVVLVESSGSIVGRVVDGAGRPVRNFRVLVRDPRDPPPGGGRGTTFGGFGGVGLTCTGGDGTFLVRNLTAGAAYRVAIVAPGLGVEVDDRVVALPRDRWTAGSAVRFELGPPNVLDIRIREPASGRPVPAARVAVVYGETFKDSLNWTANEGSRDDAVFARADAAGRASFTALAFDEGTVLVLAPGYARQNFGWRDHSANLDAWLQPEAAIEGTVVDTTTGLPPEGAVVRVSSNWLGRVEVPLEPGPTGRFRIGELAAGHYTLSVAIDRDAPAYSGMIALEVGERARRDLRVKLPGR